MNRGMAWLALPVFSWLLAAPVFAGPIVNGRDGLQSAVAVPAPGTLLLMGVGLVLIFWSLRRVRGQ